MWAAISLTNVSTDAVTFSVGVGTDGAFPVKRLAWRYETAGLEQPKQQDTGMHESNAFIRTMLITLEGQVKGSAADDYWTQRETLVKALLVNNGAQTDRHHGVLRATPEGGSEMYANVVLLDADLPTAVESDSIRLSSYTVTWRCNFGHWRLTSGDTVKKL